MPKKIMQSPETESETESEPEIKQQQKRLPLQAYAS